MNSSDFAKMREQMVEHRVSDRGLGSARVLSAMRSVPREEFLPESLREFAFEDAPCRLLPGKPSHSPIWLH